MSGRTLLVYVLVIGMLALGVYMTIQMMSPVLSPAGLAPADSTAPGYRSHGPATVDQARRDMDKMQEATRKATENNPLDRKP